VLPGSWFSIHSNHATLHHKNVNAPQGKLGR
jgi:hypothetical protein